MKRKTKSQMIDQAYNRVAHLMSEIWKIRRDSITFKQHKRNAVTRKDLTIINRRLALIANKLNFKFEE